MRSLRVGCPAGDPGPLPVLTALRGSIYLLFVQSRADKPLWKRWQVLGESGKRNGGGNIKSGNSSGQKRRPVNISRIVREMLTGRGTVPRPSNGTDQAVK